MVLGIRYLTGYCVARDLARQRPEWPPHPARVFMALAAAHFESGADPIERKALLWLESQSAPRLFASPAQRRSTVEVYVPVNDQTGGIVKRPKQSRTFPTVRPDSDTVYYFWAAEASFEIQGALVQLSAKVTRVGHSSSLTQLWVSDAPASATPNWLPDPVKPTQHLRVPAAGLLDYLERCFNGAAIQDYFRLVDEMAFAKGKKKAALRTEVKTRFNDEVPQASKPVVSSWQGYREFESSMETAQQLLDSGPFDEDFIVFTKHEGANLGLESTLQLTLAARNALLKACPEPHPEWLSGHAPDKSPSKHPHVALFPLPYVGAKFADGHILGIGMAIPANLFGEERPRPQAIRESLGPLFYNSGERAARKLRLWKNSSVEAMRAWEWILLPETREEPPVALCQGTWVGPSIQWASVTPVVLHHYPKKGNSNDVERIVREAFQSALLPQPESVEVSFASSHAGAGSIRDLPEYDKGEGFTRYSTHVVATFAEPLTGPVLVGRGRFRGYGLFKPIAGSKV